MSYEAMKLSVSHEYSGMGDYWGGNGRRWDDDAGCLFAFYGKGTTLADCVDQWVDDYWNGGDCEYHGDGRNPWEGITSDDVRAAILDSLTRQGRADYDSGAIAECAAEYAACSDPGVCRECGNSVGELHADDCVLLLDNGDDPADEFTVEEEDCDEEDDMSESPIWVILVEVIGYNDDDED